MAHVSRLSRTPIPRCARTLLKQAFLETSPDGTSDVVPEDITDPSRHQATAPGFFAHSFCTIPAASSAHRVPVL